MTESDDGADAALRAFAVAAIALAGLAFCVMAPARFLDDRLLDHEWSILRAFAPKPSADEIVVVGIDPATLDAIAAPPGLWHEPLGLALARIASAHPRAIGLDYPLPERSFDSIHPGLDRALFVGLAAAAGNGPFVVSLNIDARTRAARRIHTPFLALLGEERLAIGLLARDDDGTTRRFSLVLPTEDGGFPTFTGRLCRALERQCSDGLIDFALGAALRYVPLKSVLQVKDPALLERLFRGRIVLIGETMPYSDRVAVPVNITAWEDARHDAPAIVVHAQSLRTALAGAPREPSRPLSVLLLALGALVFLLRDWRLALAAAILVAALAFAGATFALRAGVAVSIAPLLATLALAAASRAFRARRAARGTPNIRHSG